MKANKMKAITLKGKPDSCRWTVLEVDTGLMDEYYTSKQAALKGMERWHSRRLKHTHLLIEAHDGMEGTESSFWVPYSRFLGRTLKKEAEK